MKPAIMIVDDHALFRNGLAELLRNTSDFEILNGASNGLEMQALLQQKKADVILMDMVMPAMNGYDALIYVKKNYPDIKCIAISMYDHIGAVARALSAGAVGYILKDTDTDEVKSAIHAVLKEGFYYNDIVNKVVLQKVMGGSRSNTIGATQYPELNDKEIAIIKMVSQELTTNEIGEKLCLSPRTIEGIRIQLAEKLKVRNGIGLVLYGIKSGLIDI